MRYGLPYKGGKNSIAEWLVQQLPSADTFVDLMCGGLAITHAALLSGKYEHFIANDIDGRLIPLFLDCCYGKYTVENHPEWISREEFFERKDDDAYIALVWSFGNNGMENITRLQSLQSLQSDYQSVAIPDGSLIYADPPYSDTNCGKYQGFDSQRFYEWARKQDNIFISEYSMPDDFIPYAWIEKQVLSAASTNAITAKEIIYTNQRTWAKLTDRQKEISKQNFAEQMTLTDFMEG